MLVLLVNDHLLKAAFPGVVTGKLSDVAGLLVAPALVALLLTRPAAALTKRLLHGLDRRLPERLRRFLRRLPGGARSSRGVRSDRRPSHLSGSGHHPSSVGPLRRLSRFVRSGGPWVGSDGVAVVVTGVLFAAVKTTETGAEAASHAWTFLAGPSRVLADPTDLLALPAIALAWWVRAHSLRRPPAARWRFAVTMPLAVLAVTATSAAPPTPYVGSVTVDDQDRIAVHTWPHTVWTSEDGGRTWSESTADKERKGQTAQCVPKQATRCYRVTEDRKGVEQSDDGGSTWRPSWRLSSDDIERLSRRYDDPSGFPTTLAVQARPGGHIVVVAGGPDSVVIRDVSGTWRRVSLPEEAPEVPLRGELVWAWALAACALFGFMGAGLRRYGRTYLGIAAVTCAGFAAALTPWFDYASMPANQEVSMLMGTGGLLAAVLGAPVCLGLAVAGRPRKVPVLTGVLGAPLVYAAVSLPFRAWADGSLASYQIAVALAVLLTAAVLVAGALLVRRDARAEEQRSSAGL
ncbi:hypothetical protein ACFFR3_36155 [Nonomuraea salmonea]|uniref:Exo-alpha-sialidase n=1 Tax=Nonomuraea salmonea TaxID=46181 RepID=A0ABV5NXG2_9ACTN